MNACRRAMCWMSWLGLMPLTANPLLGDWTTMAGTTAVLATPMATWIGAVLALQRRLLP